jgi:mercuric ion transport protein
MAYHVSAVLDFGFDAGGNNHQIKQIMALQSDPWFKTGLWGSIIAALCCATPILPFILGLIGLAALTRYLDFVLLPLLVVFLILTLYRWLKQKRSC